MQDRKESGHVVIILNLADKESIRVYSTTSAVAGGWMFMDVVKTMR